MQVITRKTDYRWRERHETQQAPGDVLVTHALGSCIGVAIYDPVAVVGGMLHFMLPDSSVNPQRAVESPWMFANVAIPQFFSRVYELGAIKSRT